MWERMLASLAQPRARAGSPQTSPQRHPGTRQNTRPANRAPTRGAIRPPLGPGGGHRSRPSLSARGPGWLASPMRQPREGHPDHHARPLGTARQERRCCLNRRRQRFLSTTSGGLHKPKPKPVMISKRGAFQPRLRHSVNKRRSLLPNLGQTSVCSEAVLAWQSALHCSGTCRSTDNQHNSWRAPGDGAIAVRQDFSLCVLKAPLSQT